MARRPKLEDLKQLETCSTCHYWKEVKTESGEPRRGMCRRYPDTILGVDEDGVTLQVKTVMHAEEWCGEYRPKPEALN